MVSSVIYVSIHAIFCGTAASCWWCRKNRDTHTTHYREALNVNRLLATLASSELCGLQNPTPGYTFDCLPFGLFGRLSYGQRATVCMFWELLLWRAGAGTRLLLGTVRDGWEIWYPPEWCNSNLKPTDVKASNVTYTVQWRNCPQHSYGSNVTSLE